ncbi:MAG: ferrochelatase [Alphaproteobacteria bacterium]|nr:ferrochelatase [Alphaproteobacteria bacterium]
MTPGVLFVNFGGPAGDAELVPFLANLLGDVLPGPGWLARALGRRLAPLRADRVRPAYTQIGWSPLVADTRAQVDAVRTALGAEAPPMAVGMMFTPPTMAQGLRDLLDQGVDRVLVVGLFPHWSFATSGSAYDMVHHALAEIGRPDLPVHYARAFFADATYVEAVAATVRQAVDTLDGDGPITLLFSAHGLPVSFLKRGDPYPDHVRESIRHVIDHLGWDQPWELAWQSRLGPVRWLEPNTTTTLERLGAEGVQRLVIVPVSFVGEHIETLFEIDVEYVELAHHAGIAHVGRAHALGLEPAFVTCLADLVRQGLERFGSYRCSRCLIPRPVAHRHQGRCPNCAFVFPAHLSEGSGGVG